MYYVITCMSGVWLGGGGGGWGIDEVFTWPYPLKVQAHSSRDHRPDIRCKVSG